MFKVPEQHRLPPGAYRSHRGDEGTTAKDGNNGLFRARSCIPGRVLHIAASDGLGWEHVSVSLLNGNGRPIGRTPTWQEMCHVRDLFWGPEDVVVQYHPAKSSYVNWHEGCLHLWRPSEESLPTPHPLMVGPTTKES